MATYKTQVKWSADRDWNDDADLVIEIHNRKEVVPAAGTASTGTLVSWSGPNGSGSITFFNDANSFMGTAQFPGEGPVGYRGEIKE